MTGPLSCREFTDFLTAYVEGELPDTEATEFERHIRGCPPCHDYLESYRETVRLTRLCAGGEQEPPQDAPASLVAAILAARRAGKDAGGSSRRA